LLALALVYILSGQSEGIKGNYLNYHVGIRILWAIMRMNDAEFRLLNILSIIRKYGAGNYLNLYFKVGIY
jgi:hypothetical protein